MGAQPRYFPLKLLSPSVKSPTLLESDHGDFGRRVNAHADKHGIPIHYCELGDKTKHARAEKLRWKRMMGGAKGPAKVR